MDKPCTHVFSECDGPCCSLVIRIDEMNDRHTKARNNLSRTVMIAAAVAGLIIGGVFIWAVVAQAAENWDNVINAEARV